MYGPNTGPDERTGTITVAAPGAVGSPVEVSMTQAGITIAGTYEVMICDADGLCMPATLGEQSLKEIYEVFAQATRELGEPYAGSGDVDGDGVINRDEYDDTVANAGALADFVTAVFDLECDGTHLPCPSEGEGEGEGCAAQTFAPPQAELTAWVMGSSSSSPPSAS